MAVKILNKVARLPEEYQEVEYIESTGTQYIDTGFTPNQDTRAVVDYQDVDTTISTHAIIGTRDGKTVSGFGFGGRSSHYWYSQYGNEQTPSTIFQNDNDRHVVDFNKNVLYFDESLIHTFSQQTFTSPRNLTLLMWANENNTYSSAKIYSCKIYNDAILVRDFVPCYRKSDNVIGLYDLVNDVFYTNSGSGSFLKGEDVTPYTTERVKMNVLVGGSRLPSEYQEVEYIQGTGTQYIDSEVKLASDDVVKCRFEITASTVSLSDALYGAYDAPNFFVLLMRSPNVARVGSTSNQANGSNLTTNIIYETSLTAGTYIENGTTYTFTKGASFTQNLTCYIMSRNQPNYAIVPIKAKIYSFEIVGKFNGIPCYRKSDGVVGLYDTVSNTFFTNAGTGTFIKGANVNGGYQIQPVKVNIFKKLLPETYQQVEYIESTGTQYIDTGINQVTPRTEIEIDFKITQSKEYQALYCSRVNAVPITRTLFITNLGGFRNDVGSQRTVGKQLSLETMYNLQSTKTDLILNDEIIDSYNLNATIDRKLTLLNSYNVATQEMSPIYGACVKVYKCKIFEDGTVIRDFIPCYRKTDNVIGLYDLVNDVFYTNAGTGTFAKGENSTQYIITKI